MVTFYYFLGLYFAFDCIIDFFNPIRSHRRSLDLHYQSKIECNTKEWDDFTDEYKGLLKSYLFTVITYLIWVAIGVFSSQWVAFILMLGIQLVLGKFVNILRFSGYIHIVVLAIYNLLLGCSIFFLIINYIHLDINVSEIIIETMKRLG